MHMVWNLNLFVWWLLQEMSEHLKFYLQTLNEGYNPLVFSNWLLSLE